MSPIELPTVSPEAIDRIETEVFREIRAEQATTARADAQRRRRRRGVWIGVGSAAAIVAVAAIISPAVVGGLRGGGDAGGFSMADAPAVGIPGIAIESRPESITDGSFEEAAGGAATDTGLVDVSATDAAREIIASAQATVRVDDMESAAAAIAEIATAHEGYVESMSIGVDDPSSISTPDGMEIMPYPPASSWVTIRVPADALTAAVDDLGAVGDVSAVQVDRTDVTSQAIDLRARIDATRASVERLTELMGQSGTVADLIAAEVALTERQSQLESYEQQLAQLEQQVGMSTLMVLLQPETTPVEPDPAGFGDGLAAGWNGLIATLNGIVIALGFLLPWIAVAVVVALIVWGIVRAARTRRARGTGGGARRESEADDVQPE